MQDSIQRGEPDIQCLKIDGDDATELLVDLEKLYGIAFENSRTERIYTAGDLFDYLTELVGSDEDRRKTCLTAVAYYRVRGALRWMTGGEHDLSPETDTNELLERMSEGRKLRDVWRELEERSGLDLPPLNYIWFRRQFPWIGAVVPDHSQTLGGLARQTAVWSHPRLAKEVGQNNATDLWEALCRHLIELSPGNDASRIGRETRLVV